MENALNPCGSRQHFSAAMCPLPNPRDNLTPAEWQALLFSQDARVRAEAATQCMLCEDLQVMIARDLAEPLTLWLLSQPKVCHAALVAVTHRQEPLLRLWLALHLGHCEPSVFQGLFEPIAAMLARENDARVVAEFLSHPALWVWAFVAGQASTLTEALEILLEISPPAPHSWQLVESGKCLGVISATAWGHAIKHVSRMGGHEERAWRALMPDHRVQSLLADPDRQVREAALLVLAMRS